MLKAVGHGIAMGDHANVLETVSEMITSTVGEDGIAHALTRFRLIGRE